MWTLLKAISLLSSMALASPIQAGLAATPAAQVTVTPGPTVLTLDLKGMKGQRPRQLSWSPDEQQLCLQTYDANRDASVKAVYYYLLPAGGGPPARVETPPAWAAGYWAWKSGQTAPDDPSWKIEVGIEKKIVSATSLPMGGDLARGGTVDPATAGISAETVAAHAAQSSNASIYTMRLTGVTVGEWTDHPIMPGLTFGWGPKGSGVIAFADKSSGRLTFLDRTGKTQAIEGTKNVVLPAFTPDGTRLAYLEHRGRDTYALVIATVR